MLIAKIIENNTMYNIQELHLFLCSFSLAIFTSSMFQYIIQSVYQIFFFYTCNFYNLDILQYHMIYYIHIHNYQDSNYIPHHIHLYQSVLYIHTDIYHHSNVVYCYKHLHLVYIYTYTFHAILCALFHQFLIRLNTLAFKFFTTSGTHVFAYGSLILLQLPLHLLVLILKR